MFCPLFWSVFDRQPVIAVVLWRSVRPSIGLLTNFSAAVEKFLKLACLAKSCCFSSFSKVAGCCCFTGKNDKSRNVGSIPRWDEIPHSCCSLFINNCDQWNIARTLFFGAVCTVHQDSWYSLSLNLMGECENDLNFYLFAVNIFDYFVGTESYQYSRDIFQFPAQSQTFTPNWA